jgi:hypothetical protein
MNLADDNADDPWFGLVGYTLMFLGSERVPTNKEQISKIVQTRVSRTPLERLIIR